MIAWIERQRAHIRNVLDCIERCRSYNGCTGCYYGKKTADAGCASLLLADAAELLRELDADAYRDYHRERLVDWMRRNGLGPTKVAEMLCVSYTAIENWASGKTGMRSDAIARLDDILKAERRQTNAEAKKEAQAGGDPGHAQHRPDAATGDSAREAESL